jgi:redox-sensitive bicupin YhaK (pirin superfamily)
MKFEYKTPQIYAFIPTYLLHSIKLILRTLCFKKTNKTSYIILGNILFHPAATRGSADHGWLQSYHTFSFANYYNPNRMQFGALRVLNDDTVAGGMGFGAHPHSNMEIISIPLQGDLLHQDSMGNTATIKQGDVQIMSAGTGIQHSEYNKNADSIVKFLQIWITPNKQNVPPRYQQITLNAEDRKNNLQQIVSPDPNDAGVWIHQDAWLHLAHFDAEHQTQYQPRKPTNGVYIFVLNGSLTIDDQPLGTRDGIGILPTKTITIATHTATEFLIIEVPMQ